MKFEAVIFDLDHTLFDRYETMRRIAPTFYEKYKARLRDDATFERVESLVISADKSYIHFEWEELYRRADISSIFAENPPDWLEYRSFWWDEFAKTAVEFPWARDMLEKVRQMGYRTGLITNGNSELQRSKVKMLGLTGCFDEILISGEFGEHKPAVGIFLEFARRMGIEPKKMLYVGDNPFNDVAASRSAGYMPVWVENGTGSWVAENIDMPEYILSSAADVPELLHRLEDEN